MIDNTKEYILCVAIRRTVSRPNPERSYYPGMNDIYDIELGYRHHDILNRFNDRKIYPDVADLPVSINPHDQGFYTSKGRFVDRYEAMEIAYHAGQVSDEIALNKHWHGLLINDGTGETKEEQEKYWKEHDTHKFNMLFSEHLY